LFTNPLLTRQGFFFTPQKKVGQGHDLIGKLFFINKKKIIETEEK